MEPTTMSDQPRKSPKQEIFETTANRVKQYIEQEKAVERTLRRFPHLPNQEKEENRKLVLLKVQELEGFWDLLLPFIKNIRAYISKVTDRDRATACYFLFGKTAQSFQAIFLLAR